MTRSFPGLLKQIEYDRLITSSNRRIEFDIFPFLHGGKHTSFVNKIPSIFRGVFGRKFFAWLWLIKNSKKYNYIIVRHMEFDPFALIFAWFVLIIFF